MHNTVISGTGLFRPPYSISNAELVEAFNAYVDRFNAEHAADIAAGDVVALQTSSVEFIEKASGIQNRYVMDKAGVLDPRPHVPAHCPPQRRPGQHDGRDGRASHANGVRAGRRAYIAN
jgi:beta-ketodecanoyl-[acyl-carrier-protein] synthase